MLSEHYGPRVTALEALHTTEKKKRKKNSTGLISLVQMLCTLAAGIIITGLRTMGFHGSLNWSTLDGSLSSH